MDQDCRRASHRRVGPPRSSTLAALTLELAIIQLGVTDPRLPRAAADRRRPLQIAQSQLKAQPQLTNKQILFSELEI